MNTGEALGVGGIGVFGVLAVLKTGDARERRHYTALARMWVPILPVNSVD